MCKNFILDYADYPTHSADFPDHSADYADHPGNYPDYPGQNRMEFLGSMMPQYMALSVSYFH